MIQCGILAPPEGCVSSVDSSALKSMAENLLLIKGFTVLLGEN